MVHVVPDGWREYAVSGAAQREIDTLGALERGLSDAYTVYHAVHWTNAEAGYAVHGDIDFVVVNRAGRSGQAPRRQAPSSARAHGPGRRSAVR